MPVHASIWALCWYDALRDAGLDQTRDAVEAVESARRWRSLHEQLAEPATVEGGRVDARRENAWRAVAARPRSLPQWLRRRSNCWGYGLEPSPRYRYIWVRVRWPPPPPPPWYGPWPGRSPASQNHSKFLKYFNNSLTTPPPPCGGVPRQWTDSWLTTSLPPLWVGSRGEIPCPQAESCPGCSHSKIPQHQHRATTKLR